MGETRQSLRSVRRETQNTRKVSTGQSLPTASRILEHARNRFLSSGFSKVTMDELSRELGLSKKTMYHCYRSKDALLDAVMERQFADIGSQVRGILNSPEDFVGRLILLWTTIGRVACRISKQFQADIRRHRPDLWERVEEARRTILQEHLSRMIDDGARRGLIRDDANKEILLLMYLSSVEGVVNPDVLLSNAFSTEEALTTILRVFLDGILTEKARKQFHTRLSQ